jgi:glucose/arabinose dehydrogenase
VLGRALRLAILIGLMVPASASAGVTAAVVGTFSAPTYIAAPPGDTHRLFVVQQSGQVELIKDGQRQATPFLDISSEVTDVGGEQGLLSMAFSPDYATSRRFYVYYTTRTCPQSPGCDEHVSEFTADSGGDTASAASERVLITIPHPSQSNHNGGQLQFGPDGDLYISVGDGGGGNDTEMNAQHKTTLLGKILRVSPQPGGTYTIPVGNPFSGGPECSSGPSSSTNCPEIWAYGLRNPWRFSFDSATGDMVIGDVGQSAEEEIDFAHPGQNVGANYGWPCYEGLELDSLAPASECSPLPSSVVLPVLTYPHPQNCSGASFCGDGIIGGYVIHDPTLPSLDGCYVYGDLGVPGLRAVHLDQPSASASIALGPQIGSLSSFGLDGSGTLYAADIANGDVYRIESDGNSATDPRCAPPSPPASPPAPPPAPPLASPPLPLPGPSASAPLLSGLNVSPRSFSLAGQKRGRRCVKPTKKNKHGLPCIRKVTLTVQYTLSTATTVTFKIAGRLPGRRVAGRCVAQTTGNRHHEKCTRGITLHGASAQAGKAGANTLRLVRNLAPGSYTLTATPTGGVPQHVTFNIVG